MLIARDIQGRRHEIATREQLASVMDGRDGRGRNWVMMSHQGSPYPALAVAMHGGAAHVSYIPADREAGAFAMGRRAAAGPCERATFWTSVTETIEVPDYAVISSARAFEIAAAFLESPERPRDVEWFDLAAPEPGPGTIAP